MVKRIWVVLCVLTLLITGGGFYQTPIAQAYTAEQDILLQSWRIVDQSYIDDSFNHQNWWFIRQNLLQKPLSSREETYTAISEMLSLLKDPYTRLLPPEQYRSLKVNTSGELSGVGLQINLEPNSGELEVVAPLAGSPAEAAGIQAHDRILAINDNKTTNLTLDEAAMLMRGRVGTSVSLTIRSAESEDSRVVNIVRDRISLNPVTTYIAHTKEDLAIGYLRLSQFSANASAEIAHALVKMQQQGAKGYILDLRNNPGGLLQAGIEIARLWLDDGTIVYTVNRQGSFDSFDANHTAITDAPLVVLVNEGSASASEILAGALQDNHRAVLVGEKTFGKGLIQSLFELPDGSGLAVTVAKYETPAHKDINKLGIVPNQIVAQEPIMLNQVGTEADQQYQKALELFNDTALVAEAT
ncbi:carboxyl-terminal processing protease CtpA [Gloeocapsa sp. PCC 73106]|uniref:carboxyl-terminal processing protease CtpA n=1 Tax=Gloeocapsa sp. PCC 73106 TaxID=102232 RepID=UPI0002AC11EC|nr:carboxyl-terminal processing protease CtpA [Gloeocapsa sp. PCC 73106]ELS00082.1 C-terminal processing peptidase [Gloeocapsa sp. PCC 73106]